VSDTILTNALLPSGQLVDVAITDGVIADVTPATPASREVEAGAVPAAATPTVSATVPPAESATTPPDAPAPTIHDLQGDLLLCAPAEPHAHIDKAFTADVIANSTGDLAGAISGWQDHYFSAAYDQQEDFHDTVRRASKAVELAISNGITSIRSHANVGEANRSVTAVKALAEVRHRYRDKLDLQIVALIAPSVVGRQGAYGRQQLKLALEAGADIVGGAPMLEEDPNQAITVLLDAATDAGTAVDLHTDETLDAEMLTLLELCRQVKERAFPHLVAASHCVSIGVQSASEQARISREVAEAGIFVITLPQTNLFLQARGQTTLAPRGLTAIDALLEAGVTVAGGGDNLQDPFNLVGRGDALETASLLVAAGHQSPEAAYDLVSKSARAAMGLPAAGVEVGMQADLLTLDVSSVRGATAGAVTRRRTFKDGRLIAELQTETALY